MKTSKRIMAFMLSILMCISLFPAQVFAEAADLGEATEVVEQDETAPAGEETESTVENPAEQNEETVESAAEPEEENPVTEPAAETEEAVEEPDEAEETMNNDAAADTTETCTGEHTVVTDPAVAPTCTQTGLTEGSHCSVCGEIIVAQETVPVLDHTYDNHKCTVCGTMEEGYTDSGSFGDNLSWYLTDTGVLDIFGSGAMPDLTGTTAPWNTYNSSVTSIIVEDGITTVGNYVFDGCGVMEVTLPDSVTSIGDFAFYNATRLKTITIPEGVTYIGRAAFEYCENLKSINIPSGITEVAAYTFSQSGITSVVIPDSVTSIDDYAFYWCTALKNVTIGNQVKSIGASAFDYCKQLGSVTMPDSVTTIGTKAFNACSSLTEAVLSSSLTTISDYAFAYGGLTGIVIPDSVTKIGEAAFFDCTAMTTAVFGNSVAEIGASAFAQCISLGAVQFPASLTEIGAYAFSGDTALASVEFNEGLKKLDFYAFKGDTALTTITLPASLESLSWSTFNGCYGLTGFTVAEGNTAYCDKNGVLYTLDLTELIQYPAAKEILPDDIYTIEKNTVTVDPYAFSHASKLVTIIGQSGLVTIGEHAFEECTGLLNFTMPETVTTVGADAFLNDTALLSVIIPDQTGWFNISFANETATPMTYASHIFEGTGDNTTEITKVTLPDSLTELKNYALKGWNYLTYVTMPASLQTIGISAFEGDTRIEKLWVTANVTTIGSRAFAGCTGLTDLTFNGSKPTLAEDIFTGDSFTAHYPADNTSWTEAARQSYGGTAIEWEAYNSGNKCGNSLYWSLEDGVLTISGTGNMYWYDTQDYNGVEVSTAPWGTSYDKITSLVLEYGMTSIGSSAFYGMSGIESVTVPGSVKTMNSQSFGNCTGLKTVVLEEGVETINGFRGCTSLEDVTIPSTVKKFDTNAFWDCKSIKNMYLGSIESWITIQLDGVGGSDFPNENNEVHVYVDGEPVTKVMVPEGVTSLSQNLFRNWIELEEVILPDSLEEIGEDAFYNCKNLKSITIPGKVSVIPAAAFHGCTSLETATLQTGLIEIKQNAFQGCSALKEIIIPDSVVTIGSYAFCDCTSLTNAVLGKGVTDIGERAFYGCSAMESVTIPESVKTIGEAAFSGCSALQNLYLTDLEAWLNISFENNAWSSHPNSYAKNIYLKGQPVTSVIVPDTITAIPDYAFYNWASMTEITLPDSITGIGNGVFENCSNLTSVNIPANVTSIGSSAFYNCIGLESITIPSSVTSIGSYAFYNCTGLESITISSSVTSIGSSAFYNCTGLESITIPSSVTSIGNSAFNNCTSLESVTIPASVTSIGSSAFYNCSALNELHLESLESWLKIAFSDWTSYPGASSQALTVTINGEPAESIVIPESITAIPAYAFSKWTNLKSVTISSGVTSIGASAFYNCRALSELHLESLESWLKIAFSDSESYPSAYSKGLTVTINGEPAESIVIPESITEIPAKAFSKWTNLKSVTIPSGVTSIGSEAFNRCTSLESVTIPASVTSIGSNAFYDCSALNELHLESLESWLKIDFDTGYASHPTVFSQALTVTINGEPAESIVIPESITEIPANAFSKWTNLKSVEIPSGVTSIGASAFYNCRALDELHLESLESWLKIAFSDSESYPSAYSNGLTVTINGEPAENIEIPESITEIPAKAFSKWTNLKSVTIPSSVTSIGASAFYNCTSLESITIPSSVTSIGSSAFYGDNLIITFTGDAPATFDSNAFYSLSALLLYPADNDTWTESVRQSYGGNVVWATADEKGIIASGTCGDNLNWTLNKEGLLSITGTGDMTNYSEGTAPWYSYHNVIRGLSIAKGATSLGSYAFYSLSSLTEVEIPKTVLSIGNRAFYYCRSMTSIIIPASVTTMGSYVFAYDTYLKTAGPIGGDYNIQFGWTEEIPANAFYNSKIENIVLPVTLTTIGGSAFSYTNLESIIIPASVTTIGGSVFYGCYNLKTAGPVGGDYDIQFSWTEEIPANTFCNSEIESITLSDTLVKIGESAFQYCDKLTEIQLPESLQSIGNYAFYNNDKLTEITLPDAVQVIGERAFYGCDSLTSISIGGDVTSIGGYAFGYLSNLQTMTFRGDAPATVNNSAFNSTTATVRYPYGNETWTAAKMQNYGGTLTWVAYSQGDPDHLVITSEPANTMCFVGEEPDLTGLAVGMLYTDGCVEAVSADDVTVTADTSTAGAKTAAVTYGEYEAAFTLYVHEKAETALTDEYPASAHDYEANTNQSWTVTSANAQRLLITFNAQTATEANVDFITITDGSGNQIGRYSGTQLAGVTVPVPGDTAVITLTSDDENNAYGFSIDNITAVSLTHVPVAKDIEATCTTEGLKDGSFCEICGEQLSGETIPALGHDYASTTVEATCTADGSVTYVCSRCGDTYTEVLPALGHDYVIDPAVAPTCTESGLTAGAHCSRCGDIPEDEKLIPVDEFEFNSANGHAYKVYSDDCTWEEAKANCEALGGHLVTITSAEEQAFVESINSSSAWIGAYCDDDLVWYWVTGEAFDYTNWNDGEPNNSGNNEHCAQMYPTKWNDNNGNSTCRYICEWDYPYGGEQKTVPALGHNTVTDAAVEPTCIETGLTEGTHCSRCGEVFTAQQEIAALGHGYGEPSFSWNGSNCTATFTCSRCGDTQTPETTITSAVKTPAACTTKGTTLYTATVTFNDNTYTSTRELTDIAALGHVSVTDAAVDPTCTETGLTEGTHCSRCGETLTAQEEIPALGHSYGAPEYNWSDDCKSCMAVFTCSRCGEPQELYTEIFYRQQSAPTCTEAGVTLYHAEVYFNGAYYIGAKELADIPALGHVWNEWTTDGSGIYSSTCTVCGEAATKIPGDADGNGSVDADDLLVMKQYLAGMETTVTYGADLNDDDAVDLMDLLLLKRTLADT